MAEIKNFLRVGTKSQSAKRAGNGKKNNIFRIILLIVILVVFWKMGLFDEIINRYTGTEPATEATETVTKVTPDATEEPTAEPTVEVTVEPTAEVTEEPTEEPTVEATEEPTEEPSVEATTEPTAEPTPEPEKTITYKFRNKNLLNQHYEKHGIDMGFASAAEYQTAADAVIHNPDVLTKTEKEDGDFIYYVEATNEFVVVSTDGYIRTYFLPDSGKKYYDKQ